MTIAIPPKTVADRILSRLGKPRAMRFPTKQYEQYGPYSYGYAEKEAFLNALLRPRGKKPPEGWVYLDDIQTDK